MLGTLRDTSHGLSQLILTDTIISPTFQLRKLRLRGINLLCLRPHISWEAEPGCKPLSVQPHKIYFDLILQNTSQFIPESWRHLPLACSELSSEGEYLTGILIHLSFVRERDIQSRPSELYRTSHRLRLTSPILSSWKASLWHGTNRSFINASFSPNGKHSFPLSLFDGKEDPITRGFFLKMTGSLKVKQISDSLIFIDLSIFAVDEEK